MPASPYFDFPELVQALAALGPGDISVNEAAAARPGSAMLTSAGSPNDLLWSKMEAAGGARRVTFDDAPIADARAFQFTEGGAIAVATAFRVLLARKAGVLPVPDNDAAALMAPLVEKRAHLLAGRKKFADGIAHLETVEPKTAARQAKKAELLSDARAYVRALDAVIRAINDAIAAGPNGFGLRFVDRATRILDIGDRTIRAVIEKQA